MDAVAQAQPTDNQQANKASEKRPRRMSAEAREQLTQQRWELLERINELFDKPMIALAFVWVVLLIISFTRGLSGPLVVVDNAIWLLFIFDFVLEMVIAPNKKHYLEHHWLVAISLLLPALRLIRIAEAVRLMSLTAAAESFSLVRIVAGVNRGMEALNHTLRRHGIGYIVLLTAIVTLLGAAGMLSFESQAPHEPGFHSYWDALWWTAMIMTTMGSQYWPQTMAGRVLAFLLALYAFAIFGYITATIATYFIGRESRDVARVAREERKETGETQALRDEMARMRAEMARMSALLARVDPKGENGEREGR